SAARQPSRSLAGSPTTPSCAGHTTTRPPSRRAVRDSPGTPFAASPHSALLWIAFHLRDATTPNAAATSSAASIVASSAGANSTVMLPGGVVVDANSIAVLPFVDSSADDASRRLAAGLYDDIVAALRAVPGLYVVGGSSVAPYAGTDVGPSEVGAQLGTRGVLAADVELRTGELRVAVQLTDAATGDALWRAGYERPID